ncbi:MAG TPA: TAT-variant-translocated molybdopterin oxidoreductase [Candidatus Saccharimonadales bacterium]|nr:TAT-variant-translocated molybdopterin oxidoreductase [Candidatus Saccharimonadales bacterium]
MDNVQKTGIGDVCPSKKDKLELSEVRERLSEARGPQYWRTLDELAQTPEFAEMLHREFPKHASEWTDKSSRRDFMKIMGASMALAGLSACTKQPLEPIVPYVKQPNNQLLGKPLFYATAMPLGVYGTGLLVESHEGRPTKIEGNPQHPSSLGGTDVFNQASVLTMYDPDRSQVNTYLGETRSWPEVLSSLRGSIEAEKAKQGVGLRVLSGATSSPSFVAQMQQLLKTYPQVKWYQWEAVNRDNVYAGAELAFGQPLETTYDFSKAKVVLSLDADFLSSGFPGFHKYTREFSRRRRPELKEEMLRFYAVESAPTNTAAKADHRLHLKASEVEAFARALASALGVAQVGGEFKEDQKKFASALVKDLQANRGTALVLAGDAQTPATHALAHAINGALGAAGKTVSYSEPVDPFAATSKVEQLRQLTAEMNSGKVDMLVVLNTNPVYDAPADIDFLSALNKVGLRIHLGLYQDETAKYCHWHLSGTHYLEQWGDTRSFDGTVSFIQPLISPLYSGHSESELIEFLTNEDEATSYALTQRYWQSQHSGADFKSWWDRSLHDGFVAGSASPAKPVTASAKTALPAITAAASGLEIIFRRDATIFDGRFANNGWLQETPKPMNQVCWDNPVLMSVATAKRLNLKSEDEVELELNGRKVKAALWLTPGHPDDAITVTLGYGREKAGRVGSGIGFSAYKLRASNALWNAGGVRVRATGEHYGLASPQGHQMMEGRAIVRAATLEEFIKTPGFAHEMVEAPPPGLTMYQPYEYKEHKWGMAIDLNSCVGCKTCTVACQAENNIAVVGKDQVKRGRHMNWLRIDNYHEGSPENPNTYFQPVPCMQCENAPCEVVCPVTATVHSSEGLNDMVYNRCVGTRYCSNNCPYKVRRFNFLLFSDFDTPQLKFQRNPEVSVRSRGVMEKCTYCIQRITHARIDAEEENRKVRDGEVMTACQQACPAEAIVFGDLNDSGSRVSKLKASQRNYGLLEELNTRPRTTYLAAVRNPNPELES